MRAMTDKALQLFPENEMARGALQRAMIDLEIQEVCQAFNRHKLGKASRIARETALPEVRDQYFELVETFFRELLETKMAQDQKLLILNDVYEWAGTVDWKHPVLGEMGLLLNLNNEGIH